MPEGSVDERIIRWDILACLAPEGLVKIPTGEAAPDNPPTPSMGNLGIRAMRRKQEVCVVGVQYPRARKHESTTARAYIGARLRVEIDHRHRRGGSNAWDYLGRTTIMVPLSVL